MSRRTRRKPTPNVIDLTPDEEPPAKQRRFATEIDLTGEEIMSSFADYSADVPSVAETASALFDKLIDDFDLEEWEQSVFANPMQLSTKSKLELFDKASDETYNRLHDIPFYTSPDTDTDIFWIHVNPSEQSIDFLPELRGHQDDQLMTRLNADTHDRLMSIHMRLYGDQAPANLSSFLLHECGAWGKRTLLLFHLRTLNQSTKTWSVASNNLV